LIDHFFVADVYSDLAKVFVCLQLLSLLRGGAIVELKVELSVFVFVLVGLTTDLSLRFVVACKPLAKTLDQ
jgi:hypothetical protein